MLTYRVKVISNVAINEVKLDEYTRINKHLIWCIFTIKMYLLTFKK